MFDLKLIDDKTWAVVDQNGKVHFTGTPNDCREWLDHYENLSRAQRIVHLERQKRPKTAMFSADPSR